ncbi:BAG family molecular chaperone regulator 6-like [Miscanthus floridulus]|uniref:BAG family molecular chaperone regulator 6-like n=1 Tax=Miscanthus floridulus TaxID=154761 RepID=UPI003457E035
MASRRFFSYDPYDDYYTSPYHYTYPYYQYQHPAPSRGAGGFFPAAADAAPEAVKVNPRPRVESSRSVSIPVRFVGSDPEPERRAARMPPAAAAVPRKRAPSAEAAAVRLQAAARGFMARKSVRAVREVEREAAEVAEKVAREAEALRGDGRARIAVGEALMKMLLRLDAVRGAREYRRRVTKRILALQDAVDALEPKAAPDSEAVAEENESEVTAEMAGDSNSTAATELPVDAEHGGEIEVKAAAETAADMEVDGDRIEIETAPEVVEESEKLLDGGNIDGDKPEGSDAEGEWEMVAEEVEPTTAAASTEARPQEPMASEVVSRGGEAGTADSALDTRKVMEMVAALCEQNAQQCAVIGALAERVDALERAVRRVEDAERRRRRGKKLKKEGKGGKSNNSKCYSD